MPLGEYVFRRCCASGIADVVVLVTSREQSDDPLAIAMEEAGALVFRGSLDNVLERYIKAAQHFDVDYICRVCGDSPFVDVEYIDKMFVMAEEERLDYVSFTDSIDGFFSEIISLESLKNSAKITKDPEDIEHVTAYIRKNLDKFNSRILSMGIGSIKDKVSITVDTADDFVFTKKIAEQINLDVGVDNFNYSSYSVIHVIESILELSSK